MIHKRVVVPLNGSPLAEGMLRFIVDIARPLDLEVALLQVVKAAPPYLTETMKALVLENAERSLAEARAYLAGLGADLSAKASGCGSRCGVAIPWTRSSPARVRSTPTSSR